MAMTAKIINFFDFNQAGKQDIDSDGQMEDGYKEFCTYDPTFAGFVSAINSVLSDDRLIETPIPDGKIHRFGKKKNCWYILFENINGVAVGEFGSWKDGLESKWTNYQAKDTSIDFQYQQLLDQVRYQKEQERIKSQADARDKAKADYEKADPFLDSMTHPYLETKQVKPLGDIKLKNGKLFLPMVKDIGGNESNKEPNNEPEIVSYQTISSNGDKMFLYGGEKKGTFFVIPMSETEISQSMPVVIVEGYATGASINLATGFPVLVAFDAGNLSVVAKELRDREPDINILIAGDNDYNGRGQEAAALAASLSNGKVVIPQEVGMDWNDYHVRYGLTNLKAEITGNLLNLLDKTTPPRPPCPIILEWNSVDRFSGKAPERKMLISETIPMGAVTLFAAMGDAGKGMICLDLALKVASENNILASAFGKEIMDHGKTVIISAEDDADEIHRRIQNLGSPEKNLYVIPLPNAGGTLPLIVPGKKGNGAETTTAYENLRQQLLAIKDLKLVIIDPLASFIMADINADPAVAAFTTGTLAALAQDTGASIIVPHHMTKTKTQITSPEEARALVRGSTALVDGVRCCIVLWQAPQADTNKICQAMNEKNTRNKVFYGCVVKSNGPADREIKTYIRNNIGLLEVKNTAVTRKIKAENDANLDLLEKVIAWAANVGHPFTESPNAATGIYANKERLPKELQTIGRKQIVDLTAKLLIEGKVLKYRIKEGVGKATWLDVPDGVFSKGLGELKEGAAPLWIEKKG